MIDQASNPTSQIDQTTVASSKAEYTHIAARLRRQARIALANRAIPAGR